MTTLLERLDGPADAELIAAVRRGDTEAYGSLFARHVEAARRLAQQLLRGPDADDLVSEAFAKVLVVLQRGDGPDVAFRAYLLTAVRRLHVDRVRRTSRVRVTDDLTPFDPGVPFRDTAVEAFESAAAARAFASLPEHWQVVLWHTEVEGQKPAEVAPLLGMSPNSVSALAYRAREGLRQAFLTMHADLPDDDTCAWVHGALGGYVRGTLARRDATRVEGHLEECRPCAAVLLELTEVNAHLSGLLAPALLGSAASAYVASASTGSVAAGGGVVALLDRAKDVVAAHAVTSSVAGAAATAVIGGAALVTVRPEAAPVPDAGAPSARVAPEPEAEPPTRAARPDRAPAPRPRSSEQQPLPTPVAPPAIVPEPGPGPVAPDRDPADPPAPVAEPRDTDPTDLAEPEPSPQRYDVALRTSTSRSGRGATRITVTVTGLPAGRTATLTSRGEGLVVAQASDARCLPTGIHASRCTVDTRPTGYAFLALALAPRSGSMIFEVAVAGGGTDSDPANNRSAVTVP